ncbi:hypothetical protein Cni_G12512 [Canna indica]|uniref:Carbohydrate kinase FGGY N-terminal domain-containing protein n=1 Tax=Canna indica TaxID=4628 RepID=A0AAQ3K8D8_9LILI|nr:hypothetical protein Cni_G12512 [Canna indica]
MENVDVICEAIDFDDSVFGTMDTWMIRNLTDGYGNVNLSKKPVKGVHVKNCSNAPRTMLVNLCTHEWDRSTIEALRMPMQILPKIITNSETIDVISNGWPLPGIPITSCLGDQHTTMLGQLCQKGETKLMHLQHWCIHPPPHQRRHR